MWCRKNLLFTICVLIIQVSQCKNSGNYQSKRQKGKRPQISTSNNSERWPTNISFETNNFRSNYNGLFNSLEMTTVPSTIPTNLLWQFISGFYNKSFLSEPALKSRINLHSSYSNKTRINPLKNDPLYIFTALSQMYTNIFPKSVLTATSLKKADPRTMVLGTVGIINGIIAVGAALSMSGVVVAAFLLLIKLAIAALLFTVGFIYVI